MKLRASLALVRIAGQFVPRKRREEWRKQWTAELVHRSQHDTAAPSGTRRGLIVWSLGAFAHAWYLFRTEFTMDTIWQDIRYGFRSLRNGSGLIAVAILSLAVGIGANATIFSVVDVYMFRPLPYPDADQLYAVWETSEERGWTELNFSVPNFRDMREQSRTMDIATTDGRSFNLSGEERPERLSGFQVSANFFRVIGVQPTLGRGFTPEEEVVGQNRVIILSDGLWHRRFGADPDILGRQVLLDGESHTVVGVMPPKFWYEDPSTDVWAPMAFTGEERRDRYFLEPLGRLNPGFTEEQALSEVSQIAQQIAEANAGVGIGDGGRIIPLHRAWFGEEFRVGSSIAMVAVAFVLLIACANIANLLLTRAAGREREMALRGALGAARSRIVRQLLTEAMIVSFIGGALGIVLSVFGIRAFISILPAWFPRVDDIALNGRVLGYTLGITGVTGILFGLAPALQSTTANLTDALKEGGRSGTGVRSGRLRKALVVGEISMALALLVASALLVQGYMRIRTSELGFDTKDVLTFRVTLPEHDYPDTASVNAFHEELWLRLAGLPGAVSVTATSQFPFQGSSRTFYTIPGTEIDDESRRPLTEFRYVLPDYFDTMDIPVLRGRALQRTDRVGMPRVIVINEEMAERHWPDSDPIGQAVQFSSGPREIVGVARNTWDDGPDNTMEPMIYFPTFQSMQRSAGWLVETSGPPGGLIETVRAEVLSLDPNLPAYRVMTMEELMVDDTGGDTIMAKIMAVLGIIAFLLSVGGVYGVMGYTVSQRTQEMGVRLALGARSSDVMSLVVRQGAVLASVGVVIGLGLAALVSRSLSVFLFGVNPFDPRTFATVSLALLAAALAASFFPARRATRVDPVVVLKGE